MAGSWWHVLGTGEEQERVDRVGLVAADRVGTRCRESAADADNLEALAIERIEGDRVLAALVRVLGITNGTSPSVPPSRSPEPARLTRQVEQG